LLLELGAISLVQKRSKKPLGIYTYEKANEMHIENVRKEHSVLLNCNKIICITSNFISLFIDKSSINESREYYYVVTIIEGARASSTDARISSKSFQCAHLHVAWKGISHIIGLRLIDPLCFSHSRTYLRSLRARSARSD
jgi:hypothetical protein